MPIERWNELKEYLQSEDIKSKKKRFIRRLKKDPNNNQSKRQEIEEGDNAGTLDEEEKEYFEQAKI